MVALESKIVTAFGPDKMRFLAVSRPRPPRPTSKTLSLTSLFIAFIP